MSHLSHEDFDQFKNDMEVHSTLNHPFLQRYKTHFIDQIHSLQNDGEEIDGQICIMHSFVEGNRKR